MNRTLLPLTFLFLFFSVPGFAQNKASIGGRVVDKERQIALPGITVVLEPGKLITQTDSSGYFRLTGITPGSYTISFSGVGFETKYLNNTVITTGNELTISVELDPANIQLATIVIDGKRSSARAATLESPLSVQRLTTEDIKANPGGNFDISKVIQSLPGVGGGAAGGSFRNDVIIRGGAPSENVFYLDGIEVPIINHFSTQGSGGGPQGILNVSFIEDVKLSTSAFDARYDNALSSVFQFRQKNGNKNRLQGNFRLSGTEVAATFDGPLTKKTSFLASARRSYLQLLFKLIDLPIRPNYWDFQFKTTTQINDKTTLNVLGIGAIDEFSFAAPREATPEKLYVINSNPGINQWSYTAGVSLRRLTSFGYWDLSLSRNTLDNQADKFEDNQDPENSPLTLSIRSQETENKLRLNFTNNKGRVKLSYGLVAQYVQFENNFFQLFRPAVSDSNGQVLQPEEKLESNRGLNFWRYGAYLQAGIRMFNDRLALSAGLRADANTASNSSNNLLEQLSPRISASYALSDACRINASYGMYYRLPSYTQLSFSADGNTFTNPGEYIRSTHYVAGLEFLPSSSTRFTLEGFYKGYSNYPVSVLDRISIANKGTEFGAIGNEPLQQDGRGRAYGIEFFAQQKLTNRLFGVFSYTLFWSEFTGINRRFVPASWDNRQLVSLTTGYKFNRNWELGLKFRYQGSAPYTPYDMERSRINYLTLGTGVFNFGRVNTLRLDAFHAADIRVDKKWNYKRFTLDLFLDIQNVYGAKGAGVPLYTFTRNASNTAFITTNGQPLQQNGSNAIPVLLENRDGSILPTIGIILEF